jgi:hypothetical protein
VWALAPVLVAAKIVFAFCRVAVSTEMSETLIACGDGSWGFRCRFTSGYLLPLLRELKGKDNHLPNTKGAITNLTLDNRR